jgi:clan AA aspartic protease
MLPIRVEGPTGLIVNLDAIIDTGFSSYLTLPTHIVSELNLEYARHDSFELADGTLINLKVYWVNLHWGDQLLTIPSIATGSEPLIGMSLLYGNRVILDVIDGGGVRIAPLS